MLSGSMIYQGASAISVLVGIWFALPSVSQAAGPEIAVSCGSSINKAVIRSSRQLGNLKAIHINIDSDNKCHIEVVLEMKATAAEHHTPRSSSVQLRTGHVDTLHAERCFSFSGKRYCE